MYILFAFIYINLQETLDGFLHTDRLKEKIVKVLKQIHQEKAKEEVRVDMWCHFGRAYITKVDEGRDLNRVSETYYYATRRTMYECRWSQDLRLFNNITEKDNLTAA